MSDVLITVGTTAIYTSAIYDNDATVWPNDTMLLDEWADIEQLWLNDPGLSIDHRTDGRSTASFVVYDAAGSLTFYERQRVIIQAWDGEKSFGGVVQSCQTVPIPGTLMKFHSIEAVDYTSVLGWRMIDYAATDKLPGVAVQEILDEYLAEEGITAGYIEDGNVLTEISIGNKSALEGLQKLAEACGFVVYLDYDLKLYFHTRTLYAADWQVSDGEDILADSLDITRENPDYRNTEIIIGGYEETDLQTESWIGDGTTKTFPLAYPANRFSTVTVGATAQTIGQKGTDAGTYDCYYAINSETITFDIAPANGAVIVAEYYGLWRSKSKAEDLTAIANNITRQGFGSGKVEHITVDESLNSIVAAGEYASAKIAEYGVDGLRISYKTLRSGLAAGVLQNFNYMGINEDILIYHVSEEWKDGITTYSVEGVYGPVIDDWVNFLNTSYQLVYEVREGVEESTGVTKLYNFAHTFYLADRPNPFTAAAIGTGLAVSDDSWPCFEEDDRTEYIEFWNDGACVFRKQHTSVPDETEDDEYHSYSFISPSDALGEIDEVVFWGGSLATITYGSGVELFRANFSRIKTILESYQINATYINGEA